MALHGMLYGTTSSGGDYGGGTVFELSTSSKYRVVYSFKAGSSDGVDPYAQLLIVNGKLYGTTVSGGTQNGGTVFSITPGGTEKVLHSFAKGTDGLEPLAGMTYKGGKLVGTTYLGGVYGVGTVFSLTP